MLCALGVQAIGAVTPMSLQKIGQTLSVLACTLQHHGIPWTVDDAQDYEALGNLSSVPAEHAERSYNWDENILLNRKI